MPVRSRRGDPLLWVLCSAMLLDALEVSVLLPVLPAIAADLRIGPASAQWTMSGFAAGFAALLLPGPRLTARFGLRRSYLVALAVFACTAIGTVFAGNATLLVAIRVVQGGCAALTAPAGLAVVATRWPEGTARRRAVGGYAFSGAIGFSVGLVLSGLLALAYWRWILVLPGLVALPLAVLAVRLLPPDPPRRAAAPRTSPGPLTRGPLLRSALGAALLNGSYLGLLLTTVFTLGDDLHWASWAIAVGLLPACLPLACSAPLNSRLIARFGTEPLIACGAVVALLGYLLAAVAPPTYLLGALPSLVLVGVGFVLSFAALNSQAVEGVPAQDARRAVACYQFCVQSGAVALLVLTGYAPGSHERHEVVAVAGLAALIVAVAGLVAAPHRYGGSHAGTS